jgi:hypothetical protein
MHTLALFDDFQRQTTKQLSEEGPEARKKVVKMKEEKEKGTAHLCPTRS